MIDSAFALSVGFTSQNFKGRPVKPRKITSKGMRPIVIGANQLVDINDTYLWLDEGKMRVIIAKTDPHEHNIFGLDDLMVNIAQLGYDVCLARTENSDYKNEEPYTFTDVVEDFRGQKVKIYTMSSFDILTKIHPIVLKKIRNTHANIIETIQKLEIDRLKKIDLINYAISISDPTIPFISGDDALFMPESEVNRRYPFAEDILFHYFLRDAPHIFPPNPHPGRKILKQDCVMEYDGEGWVLFRKLQQEPNPVDEIMPPVKDSVEQTSSQHDA